MIIGVLGYGDCLGYVSGSIHQLQNIMHYAGTLMNEDG